MDDLISRQEALMYLNSIKDVVFIAGSQYTSLQIINHAIEYIKSLSPAEPKKGKWIISPYPDRDDVQNYECDNCGMSFSYNKYTEAKPNYCMHCGADMRGEKA